MRGTGGSDQQRIRLFRSDRLERLTQFTPTAFVLTWCGVIALACFAGWGTTGVAAAAGLILGGITLWTLFEYGMHRFIFHLKFESSWGRRLIFLTHGNHHADPGDRYRNIMPPIVSLVLLGSIWVIFLLSIGPAGSVLFVGFSMGYVAYDSIHFACHQFPMRAPILRTLQRHHTRHHHARRDGNYAITAIFWDRVFGTDIPVKERRAG
jgi:sterol desaturase/sphingolipid hydroxylase (fatty acid hydroxylase superfamily)